MAGSLLVETATGLGKREFSAALDYQKMHDNIVHAYVPRLTDLMMRSRPLMQKLKTWGGGQAKADADFWRDVQLDRLERREFKKDGIFGEFKSRFGADVQEAGRLLDSFIKDSAENMHARGHEEGTAILAAGVEGHVPYHFNNKEVRRLGNEEKAVAEALQGILKKQFEQKLIMPAVKDLSANAERYVKERADELTDRVTRLESELDALAQTADNLTDVRGAVANADAAVKTIREQLKEARAAEKALKAEVESLTDAPRSLAAIQAEMLQRKLYL